MSEDIYIHNVEEELIQDLIDNFSESYEVIESNLSAMLSQPDDQFLIDGCFRSIHSVKSNATVCELDPIVSLSQAIEDVIYSIKTKKIIYNDILCDVVLISLDRLKEVIYAVIDHKSIAGFQREEIQSLLTNISRAKDTEYTSEAEKLITLITGRFNPISTEAEKPKTKQEENTKDDTKEIDAAVTQISDNSLNDVVREDLMFFRMLAAKIDKKNPAWEGRTQQLIELALTINESAGNPICPSKLTAAVCLHDIGMAFIPNHVLFKKGKLTKEEVNLINRHTSQGASITKRLINWSDTGNIVQQHHERPDGKGYPEGLKSASISDGAKIMAIVDAFYSMTNNRSDRDHKRSFIRGISEINACSGTQFAEKWIEHFNAVMLNKNKRDQVAKA